MFYRLQFLLPALVAVAIALPHTASAAKDGRDNKKDQLALVPAWTKEPDRIKLEIVERLVLEKQQYSAAVSLIAALRQEGVTAPILDLLQGISLREAGLFEDSERLLVQARKKMPGDARVHEALCVLYADTRELDQAIAACEKATKVDTERASAWNNLAYLYLVNDRVIEAIEASQRAVDLDASEARYRNNLGLAQVAQGEHDHALGTFRTTGSTADAYYNVGFSVERWEGAEAALSWYRRALEINAEHVLSVRALDRITNLESDEQESTP